MSVRQKTILTKILRPIKTNSVEMQNPFFKFVLFFESLGLWELLHGAKSKRTKIVYYILFEYVSLGKGLSRQRDVE